MTSYRIAQNPNRRVRELFVQKIFRARIAKFGNVIGPSGNNSIDQVATLEPVYCGLGTNQNDHLGNLEVIGVELVQGFREFQTTADGIERRTIGDPEAHALASDRAKSVEGGRERSVSKHAR